MGSEKSSPRLLPKRYATLGAVLCLLIVPSQTLGEEEETDTNILITYDVSGSMAHRFISASAHVRLKTYLQWLLIDGWRAHSPFEDDEIVEGADSALLAGPLLSEGTTWSAYYFGDDVRNVVPASDAKLTVQALDRLYPSRFPDQTTNIAAVLRLVCVIGDGLDPQETRLLWVQVSDNLSEQPETDPSVDERIAGPSEDYHWSLLFALKVAGGGIYDGKAHYAYLQVRRVVPVEAGVSAVDAPPQTPSAMPAREPEHEAKEPQDALEVAEEMARKAKVDSRFYFKALDAYQRVLEFDATNTQALYGMAKSHYELKQWAEAKEAIDVAIDNDGHRPEFFVLRGQVLEVMEQYDSAVADLRRALELDPNHGRAYYVLGTIYDGTYGEPWQALANYSKAIHAEPAMVEAYFYRALTYRLLNNGDSARADFDTVVRLAPQSTWAGIARPYLDANND